MAMNLVETRALERLLQTGASQSDIATFLRTLSIEIADEAIFRDQMQFLSTLYQKGIHIDRRRGSRIAFIFFSSLLDPIGTAVARLVLSRLNANCIYLHDDQDLNFTLGVSQCGASVEQTNAALRQYIRQWGVSRVITVASSAAGFSAITNALRLDAYASVTLAPFTTFAKEYEQHDGRGLAMVQRIIELVPSALTDVVPLLIKHDPPLELVCFYPKAIPQDVWQAQRLRGIPGIRLIETNVKRHNLLVPFVLQGIFEAFMQRLAEGASIQLAYDLVLARFPETARHHTAITLDAHRDQSPPVRSDQAVFPRSKKLYMCSTSPQALHALRQKP
jgi:hypothetical protein